MRQSLNLQRLLKCGLSGTALSLIMATGITGALAQQAQQQPTDSVLLETITVKGQDQLEPTSQPAAVSTISSTEIKLNGREKLDTVLRSTPGVFTTINGSNPGVAVNIRGFEGSGRVNMMIDGAPQTFRTTSHDAQGYSYIDPNLLSSIDITRGAVTTEGGSGLAGSVNFKTLGVDDILIDGKDKGVLGRLSWGSNGVGFSEMLAGAARVNSMGIAGAISRRDSNDYKNGDGINVEKTGQELTSGLFKTEFGFGEDHKLVLGGIIYNNKFGTWQPGYTGGATIYDMFLQNRTFTANYTYKPGDNELIDLAVNGYFNSTKLSYTGGNGSYVGREIKNESIGFNVANTSHFTAGELMVDWKYGVEFNHDKTGGTKVGVNPIDSTADRSAAFTQVEWGYDRLQVLTGLRYDHYKLENTDEGIDNSEGRLNPKVTVAYHITDWLQPYATYAHSMRAPTLQETMLGGVAHSGAGMMKGNPNLVPEKQRGWELGVNVVHDSLLTAEDTLRLKANYFHMRVEDYITAAPDMSQFINVDGTSTVSGFELQANYDAGFAFGGIAYTHSNTDLPAQKAGMGSGQYLPENVVTLTAGGRFLERKLETGIRYQYVSSGEGIDYSGSFKSPSYNLVDIFATYKLNENADLSFKVTNLFDKAYTPALSTYGSGQGRTFVLSTQFQF